MLKVFFKTFGCRTNLYDTQVMINNLKNYNVTEQEELADIIIINSCTVTNKADREARSYARKQANMGKRVVFTGCGAKNLGKILFKEGIAHNVFTHAHKENINNILLNQDKNIVLSEEYKHVDSTIFPEVVGKIRAFIKIQEGCNFSCSYCIIPSVRGAARSFSEKQILNQIEILAQNGISEVVLTGTNIGSYGLDTNTNIAELIHKIHEISGIKRIRLGSLEPSQIDSIFLETLKLEKLERHLHIALQHTSPRMLKIMNRKNTFERDLELFTFIASNGFSLGTDYIIGHYGESEEIFNEGLRNLEKMPLTHIHPFIYSPRTGTKSAQNKDKLEIISGDKSKNRLKQINNIVQQKNEIFRLKMKQNNLLVLIDGQKNLIYKKDSKEQGIECLTGLDQYYNRIYIPLDLNTTNIKKGQWVNITDYEVGVHNIARKIAL